MIVRILRSPHLFPSDALPGSRDGLGRFSHLVNVELIQEISDELRHLVLKKSLEHHHALDAITSVVRLTKGAGSVLNVSCRISTIQSFNIYFVIMFQ